MTLNNQCATGEKRFQQLDPEQFRPRGPVVRTGKYLKRETEWKTCHLCEQPNPIKPDGFFYAHTSSAAGHISSNMTTASGKPARERRTR